MSRRRLLFLWTVDRIGNKGLLSYRKIGISSRLITALENCENEKGLWTNDGILHQAELKPISGRRSRPGAGVEESVVSNQLADSFR